MAILIGNAPCSWGVEFAAADSNPSWQAVLEETHRSGYTGVELGPVGYMPEDESVLRNTLRENNLTLTAGVVFQPFHDPAAWDRIREVTHRTSRILQAMGASYLVLIDSPAADRSRYAGDSVHAPRLESGDLRGMHEQLRTVATIGRDGYGLIPCLHSHAAGYIEFEDELDRALDAVDESLLSVCLDTGHSLYAGFDPLAVYRRLASRVPYIHLKDVNRTILEQSVKERVGFYEACSRGVFCNLGIGALDFRGFTGALDRSGYTGWATVEQDRGPLSVQSSFDDAVANYRFLQSIGLAP